MLKKRLISIPIQKPSEELEFYFAKNTLSRHRQYRYEQSLQRDAGFISSPKQKKSTTVDSRVKREKRKIPSEEGYKLL
jgi:hypothetical protein